jgi:hypothetical protein
MLSSGKFLATDPEVRVRFPALPDFLRSSGLERGPLSLINTTESYLEEILATPVYKTQNTAVGIRHADYVALSIHKILH